MRDILPKIQKLAQAPMLEEPSLAVKIESSHQLKSLLPCHHPQPNCFMSGRAGFSSIKSGSAFRRDMLSPLFTT